MIHVTGLVNRFGSQVVHDDLEFAVRRGEVMGLVGGSGTGKSVLMRTIIGLNRPTAGSIEVFGQDVTRIAEGARRRLQRRWGVLFQDGALFSSLTVGQNIEVPLIEHTGMSASLRRELVALKLALVGLPAEAAFKFPSEISGGMRKRVGLARALALDAEILFLDEPTAGLDPISASAFDELIRTLQATLHLSVVLVTHDLDTLHGICDRVSALLEQDGDRGHHSRTDAGRGSLDPGVLPGSARPRAAEAADLRRHAAAEGSA